MALDFGNYADAVLFLVLLVPSFALILQLQSPESSYKALWMLLTSGAAGVATFVLIPPMSQLNLAKGLFGIDLGKRFTDLKDRKVPEAVGLVSGMVFVVSMILGQLVFAVDGASLASYNTALLSVVFMILLGFIDDVLDLAWRYKLILPTIASLPLLVGWLCPAGQCNGSVTGGTAMLVPALLRSFLVDEESGTLKFLGVVIETILPGTTVDTAAQGAIIELGVWFYVYMSLLAVFCTNAINIYAGINGLEVGQSIVIGCFMLLTCLIELFRGAVSDSPHMFASTLLGPFLATSLALWAYNRYPAQVFVGDTYCYFAGMTFAVSGILGHFSKTLLLFFLPQIINFLYSTPQLFKIVPCPRHRLPQIDPTSGLMIPSTWERKQKDPKSNELVTTATGDNMTLICLVLRLTGPIRESTLNSILLWIQAFSCAIALGIRLAWPRF